MHLSMVCPTIPGADVGERRGICCPNLPCGVGTLLLVPIHSDGMHSLLLCFVNSTNTRTHTVHSREMWGICRVLIGIVDIYVGGWCAGLYPRYGGLSIRIPLLSPIKPQVLEVGCVTDRRINFHETWETL